MRTRPSPPLVALFPLVGLLALAAPGCLDRPTTIVQTHGVSVGYIPLAATRLDKVDLLIMVDNSSSMEDKQAELGNRIPQLITKLTSQTVDPTTGHASGISDLHVGVITSSLGSFGTSVCKPSVHGAHQDDHAYLLPRAGEGPIGAAKSNAPMAWAVDAAHAAGASYVGASGADALSKDVTAVVASAGVDGCGYEAQMEAIYRFLSDPAPYQSASASCTPVLGAGGQPVGDNCSGSIALDGVDHTLLAQRAAFLRPDSLLVVLVLTDEDDGSLRPLGGDWLPWAVPEQNMPHGWASCANVPDDFETDDYHQLKTMYGCTSCLLDPSDPACKSSWPSNRLDVDADGLNNRQTQQVQKYGVNFLWSRDHFVQGFTATSVRGSDGKTGTNGIFAGGARTPDKVIVAAITGVPEDLVAGADHSLLALDAAGWAKITAADHHARDPRMIEGVAPRTAFGATKYKGGGDLSASPYGGTAPFFNGNGGERDIASGDDLQYACIQARSATAVNDDCNGTDAASNPLCTATGGGNYKQSFYKAYPGLRQLRVVQALGASGVAASICAKDFTPALDAVFAKVKEALDGECVQMVLNPDADGQVPCVIAEVMATDKGPNGEASCEAIGSGTGKGYCTPGSAPCRVDGSIFAPLKASDAAAAGSFTLTETPPGGAATSKVEQAFVGSDGNVYVTGSLDGKRHLVCEERQLTGADGKSCRTDPSYMPPTGAGGYCYSTTASVIGAKCVAEEAQGTIKFRGTNVPNAGSQVFTSCIGGGS